MVHANKQISGNMSLGYFTRMLTGPLQLHPTMRDICEDKSRLPNTDRFPFLRVYDFFDSFVRSEDRCKAVEASQEDREASVDERVGYSFDIASICVPLAIMSIRWSDSRSSSIYF